MYRLGDISEKHSKDFAKYMHAQEYHYGMDQMTVLLSAELNTNTSIVYRMLDETECRMVVKSGLVLILLEAHHSWNAVHMTQEEGSYPWTDGHLGVNIIERRDGAVILQAEALLLSKVAITMTAIVRKEITFVDVMKALVTYGEGFSLQQKISFVNARIKDTVEDTMYSGFLPT